MWEERRERKDMRKREGGRQVEEREEEKMEEGEREETILSFEFFSFSPLLPLFFMGLDRCQGGLRRQAGSGREQF